MQPERHDIELSINGTIYRRAVESRTLLSDFLPVQSMRAVGLHLMGSIGPLRRLAMREGLAPSWRRVS